MPENKSLGHLAFDAAHSHEAGPIGDYRSFDDPTRSAWEAAAQAVRSAVIEECIQAVKAQQESFASEEYATGQPHSSFGERFACKSCIEALEGLKGETDGQ